MYFCELNFYSKLIGLMWQECSSDVCVLLGLNGDVCFTTNDHQVSAFEQKHCNTFRGCRFKVPAGNYIMGFNGTIAHNDYSTTSFFKLNTN